MSSKDVILIIGVGRSGTSAIARVLALSGCALPKKMLGATELNQKGCWEPIDIWKLNHNFMLRHGTEYTDPTMRLQEMNIDEGAREEYIQHIREFLSGPFSGPALLVKQPDITEVMELWIEACRRDGVSLKIVIPIRHPGEVFASLVAARMVVSVELANAFWLKRSLLAERHSRGFQRVFVEYSNLLKGWRLEVDRVSRALSVKMDPDELAIDGFLTSDLHRQRCSSPIVETFGDSWMTRVYSILSRAAQDDPIDLSSMNEIYHAYRANERAFRIAWDEFRDSFSHSNPQQLHQALENAPVMLAGRDF